MILVVLILRFCLFKQKTAYEMRISDWSSYVCSSDLRLAQLLNGFIDTVGALGQRFQAHDHAAAVGARYAALGLTDRRLHPQYIGILQDDVGEPALDRKSVV